MQWPWRKQPKAPDPLASRPAHALRHLYRNYQRQERMWGLVILSALGVACLFFVFSVVTPVSFYIFSAPLIVIVFAGFQLRRCRELVRILRHALTIQQTIDKADAVRQKEAEEAEARRQRLLEERVKKLEQDAAAQRATDEAVPEIPEPEPPAGGQ